MRNALGEGDAGVTNKCTQTERLWTSGGRKRVLHEKWLQINCENSYLFCTNTISLAANTKTGLKVVLIFRSNDHKQ